MSLSCPQSKLTFQEKTQRFLYTCSYFGTFIGGDLKRYLCRFTTGPLFRDFDASSADDFPQLIASANEDPLVAERLTVLYLMAEAINSPLVPHEVKALIQEQVYTTAESDQEFFQFIKYLTAWGASPKRKLPSKAKNMILRFYRSKGPLQLAQCVTKQESYFGWTHKELLKLCHYKTKNEVCATIVKCVLFGLEHLPENPTGELKTIGDLLRKSQELRTTTSVPRAVALIKELDASVDQVNSTFNKHMDVWLAALPGMTTRQILQFLYKFFEMGFLRVGTPFQTTLIELITSPDKIKECKLHPVEVYIYKTVFERGGKTLDPQLVDYLKKRNMHEDTLDQLLQPPKPKCIAIRRSIGLCLRLSYAYVKPTLKRLMITIDVTDKAQDYCFQNKRITFLEAAVSLSVFLHKMDDKRVFVALVMDGQIKYVDVSKPHITLQRLQGYKSKYIHASTPLLWALKQKKFIDIFINIISCDWMSKVPEHVHTAIAPLPDALSTYTRKMKMPSVRVVNMYLNGPTDDCAVENGRNIFAIAGFSPQVPRVLEAFCRGRFY